MKAPKSKPSAPETEKALTLNAIYQYLGALLESVARRASITMVLLGSFLGFAATGVLKTDGMNLHAKITFALTHPSIILGLAGMFFLLWCETAKVKRQNDFVSRIAFTDEPLNKLTAFYQKAGRAEVFSEMIKSIRLVGVLLRKKILFYNIGSLLFVLAITLYVAGF